jgi:hypothetical protein
MKPRLVFILLLAALLLLLSVPAAQADTQAYDLPWWKVAAGGGESQGGSYLLGGTAGQAEPGSLSGGPYVLESGFWSGSARVNHQIFLPIVTRSQ